MRVGLQGWGTEGDNRPLIALAGALRRAGHQVRLVLTVIDGKDYSSLCRTLEVPLRVVPEKLDFSLANVASETDHVNPLKVAREITSRALEPYQEELYAAGLELCAQSDLLVWTYTCWPAKAAALKTGTPSVALHFYPGYASSRSAAPPGFPSLGFLNRMLWRLFQQRLDAGFRAGPASFFAAKGLPPLLHAFPDLLFSEQLNLHAASPSFYPPAPDWAPLHQVCGHLSMPDASESWQPSASLRAFLDAGDKPVLMSLGSLEHMAPRRARALLIDGARAAKVRAIVQTKREPQAEGQDGDLYFLPWAPYGRLLPECAAVVHHGGAGTSHACLRAGLPSVVVPFIFEQRLWAKQLLRSGTAGKPLSFWKATPETLAARIQEVLASESMSRRARELAASMANEDGLATAIAALERLAGAGNSGTD